MQCTVFPVLAYQPAQEITDTAFLDTPQPYALQPGDAAWDDLSMEERYQIANVPLETSEKLTTHALLLTLLNSPFIANIYAFNSINEGIDRFKEAFPAMDALLAREDILTILDEYVSAFRIADMDAESEAAVPYYVACRLCQYIVDSITVDPYVLSIQTLDGLPFISRLLKTAM